MKWNKYRGKHPLFTCNVCSLNFDINGFEHQRPVNKDSPEMGILTLVVCTSACRKLADKYHPTLIDAHFEELRNVAILRWEKRDLKEEIKEKQEFLNIFKDAAKEIGLELIDVNSDY
jgi:hypothetical protein